MLVVCTRCDPQGTAWSLDKLCKSADEVAALIEDYTQARSKQSKADALQKLIQTTQLVGKSVAAILKAEMDVATFHTQRDLYIEAQNAMAVYEETQASLNVHRDAIRNFRLPGLAQGLSSASAQPRQARLASLRPGPRSLCSLRPSPRRLWSCPLRRWPCWLLRWRLRLRSRPRQGLSRRRRRGCSTSSSRCSCVGS